MTVSNCIMDGGFSGGTNIITSDPLFVDADGNDDIIGTLDDNLHLLQSSPALNAGTADTTGLKLPSIDMDGMPRIDNQVIDIGPYESVTPVSIYSNSTLNKNSEVNLFPNPTIGPLNLVGLEAGSYCNVKVINQVGQAVYAKNSIIENQLMNLDLSELNSGAYIIQITSNNSLIFKKVIIQ